MEVLKDLENELVKNEIHVGGMDAQTQQLLFVLEQPPSGKKVVANVKAEAAKPTQKRDKRHSKKLPGHGVLLEFCTDPESNLE